MTTEYRNSAKLALMRAHQALNSGESAQLRYAALELRMALECFVYERAQNYREELSNKKLNTWQPRQLLILLLEIDPNVDKTSTISFGLEDAYGTPAKEMINLGSDRVISLQEIKEYYDRLGSYLHTPTAEQCAQGKGEPNERLRRSCEDLCLIIEAVLKSKVWNADFKRVTSLLCGKCGNKIVRRLPVNGGTLVAACIECQASYTITETSDGEIVWQSNQQEELCANPDCGEAVFIWPGDRALGKSWKCTKCGGTNMFSLGVEFKPMSEK